MKSPNEALDPARLFFVPTIDDVGGRFFRSADVGAEGAVRGFGFQSDTSGQLQPATFWVQKVDDLLLLLQNLLRLDPGTMSASEKFWREVTVFTLRQIAREEVFPAVNLRGYPTWRALQPRGRAALELRVLVNSFPLEAVLAVDYGEENKAENNDLKFDDLGSVFASEPRISIEDFRHLLVDLWVRQAGVAEVFGSSVLSVANQSELGGPELSMAVRDWFGIIMDRVAPATRIGLRLDLNADAETETELNPKLNIFVSADLDDSLRLDLDDLWSAPPAIRRMFSDSVEEDVLVAIRRASLAFGPIGRSLNTVLPGAVDLSMDEVASLISEGVEALGAEGMSVLLPNALIPVEISAVGRESRPADGDASNGGLSVRGVMQIRLRPSIYGEELTDEEIQAISDAKRLLVRIRGGWVRADKDLIRRILRTETTLPEFVASALLGVIDVSGNEITALPSSDLKAIVEGIRRAAEQGESLIEPAGLHATLRGYQRTGLAWMYELYRSGIGGCLADDMGLGKTVQVIALQLYILDGVEHPTLVVCPTSVVGNWVKEFSRFAPEVRVHRYTGQRRQIDDLRAGDVLVTSYPILRIDQDQLANKEFALVVADEAQFVKNYRSKTARALRRIKSRSRIALTGTPIENSLVDLWSILDWVLPGQFGSWTRFQQQVVKPIQADSEGEAANRFARQLGPFLMRRKKTDPGIAPELPPISIQDLVVPMSNEQVSLYKAVVAEAMEELAESEGMHRKGMILALLTSLKQICNHPAQYLKENGPIMARSAKLDALLELMDVIVSESEQCLVFTQYVTMGRILERAFEELGMKCCFLHGGTESGLRDEMVKEFQSGMFPIFIISLKAGGTGLNLTAANHVIHFDRWWNPATENQATDRAYRIGQTRSVSVYRLISEGTVEEKIAELQQSKRRVADSILGGGEGWITELANEELAELVALSGID